MSDENDRQRSGLPIPIIVFAVAAIGIAAGAIALYIGMFWRMFG